MRHYDAPNPELVDDYLAEGTFARRPGIPDTPEAHAALETATKKLDALMDTEDFCYRFMHIDEYREIMQSKEYGGEVIVNNPSGKTDRSEQPLPFREFAGQRKKAMDGSNRNPLFWAHFGRRKTDWGTSTALIENQNDFIGFYNRCRREATLADARAQNMDKESLAAKKFRDYLKKAADDRPEQLEKLRNPSRRSSIEMQAIEQFSWSKIVEVALHWDESQKEQAKLSESITRHYGSHAEYILRVASERAAELADENELFKPIGKDRIVHKRETLDADVEEYNALVGPYEKNVYMERFFGRNNIDRLAVFLQDPKSVPMRDVITILSHVQRERPGEAWKQYMVLVVFGEDALNEGKQSSWGMVTSARKLRSFATKPDDPGDSVLAVMSLVPNKEITHELIATSLAGNSFAHAVLDQNGNLQFPSKKNALR